MTTKFMTNKTRRNEATNLSDDNDHDSCYKNDVNLLFKTALHEEKWNAKSQLPMYKSYLLLSVKLTFSLVSADKFSKI